MTQRYFKKNKKAFKKLPLSVFIIISLLIGLLTYFQDDIIRFIESYSQPTYSLQEIPTFNMEPFITINNNVPEFSDKDYNIEAMEIYSELDALGRCGIAFARVGIETMPTEERGSIGMIKPSGWHTVKYENINGKYLYNRCHLIGFQLTGENANPRNLITCTRYMNTTGMLDFENKVAQYVKETKNHVLYRVTPYFKENNLLASGVQIEAKSVEDDGKGIQFNVYVYNVQDGITIDYKTGESSLQN